jgi:hypothetical protein
MRIMSIDLGVDGAIVCFWTDGMTEPRVRHIFSWRSWQPSRPAVEEKVATAFHDLLLDFKPEYIVTEKPTARKGRAKVGMSQTAKLHFLRGLAWYQRGPIPAEWIAVTGQGGKRVELAWHIFRLAATRAKMEGIGGDDLNREKGEHVRDAAAIGHKAVGEIKQRKLATQQG